MRHIICLSGGIASAWVAKWAKENLSGDIVYYYNDTGWEHPDLHRFLGDISLVLGISITVDSDGRTPEDVFYDQRMLANNRVPLCSKVLKAKRLQKFAQPGDVCYFGIDLHEAHRAERISQIYAGLHVLCRFPLIETKTEKSAARKAIIDLGIQEPELYRLGFDHNNCSGGCVRAGTRQWVKLYHQLPDVFRDRERVESEISFFLGKRLTFMKDESLKELRNRIEAQGVLDFGQESREATECVGICTLEN